MIPNSLGGVKVVDIRDEAFKWKSGITSVGIPDSVKFFDDSAFYVGWSELKTDRIMSGTVGLGLRLEAIKINLIGADVDLVDVYYQVHAERVGWLNWAKNGEESGNEGFGY